MLEIYYLPELPIQGWVRPCRETRALERDLARVRQQVVPQPAVRMVGGYLSRRLEDASLMG
jgi:hypothetical protein